MRTPRPSGRAWADEIDDDAAAALRALYDRTPSARVLGEKAAGILVFPNIVKAGLDGRRQLVVEEANAIGTAYLRLDVLPHEAQPALRDKFRRYVEARLDAYRKLPDIAAAKEGLARAAVLQGEIWGEAVAASRAASPSRRRCSSFPPSTR